MIWYHHENNSNNEDMYTLVLDVNQDYGNYLVPLNRMYQAIKYRDHNGNSGGLLKIEAHSIL